MAQQNIIVVGAGILGASIAWHLARRGARVTVLDEGNPANRATLGSFAWINAHDPQDMVYFDLRMQSIRLWRGLQAAMPDLPVRFGGTLNWEDAPDTIEEVARALDEGGNPARVVSGRTITEMEPALAAPPDLAIDASGEGVANPNGIAEGLLAAAEREGAQVRRDTAITGLHIKGQRVAGVETADGVIEADTVVLAVGVATADVLAGVGFDLPMENAPGLLIQTAPVPKVSQRVLTSMSLHVWQKDDGSLLVGEDFGGSDPSEGVAAIQTRVLKKLDGYFAGVGRVDVRETTVTKRPMPADRYPAVGPVPGIDGLWAATTHSGITLAPVIGASLAEEIVGGGEVAALAPYRVARFGG